MPFIQNNDTTLYYETSGQGEPLLLLMGLGVDHRGWMMQLPAFRRYQLILPDNRGVGQSAAAEGQWTVGDMARDALAVLEAEGVAKAHVVGISMGGMIGLELALLAPERVQSLTLAATYAAPGEEEKAMFRTLLKHLTGLEEVVDETLSTQQVSMEEVITMSLPLNFTPAFLKENKGLVRGFVEMLSGGVPSFGHYVRQFAATQTFDVRDRLGLVACSVQVIKPAKDQLINPARSDELAAGIPHAQLSVMPDAPHACNVEGVDMFNDLVVGFLAAHPMG